MNLCNHRQRPHVARQLTLALALSFVPLFGACGGGFEDEALLHLPLAAAPAAPAEATLPPLLDDNGRPQAPLSAAVPLRGDHLTHAGRYALRAQAEALDIALRSDVIWVDVDCCRENAVEEALGIVAGLAAIRDLSAGAPVFVTGGDLRIAAAAADRLGTLGYSHVFLVTR